MQKQPMDNSTPLEGGFNFTPIYNNERVRMRLSDADRLKLRRGRGLHGVVTDLDTGKQYKVYGRACGLRCFCDSEIKDCPEVVLPSA